MAEATNTELLKETLANLLVLNVDAYANSALIEAELARAKALADTL